MSDQTDLGVPMPNTYNLDEVRAAFLSAIGRTRRRTVVRYTSGPQTLAGTVDLVTCDAAGGSFTVNLPAAPLDGDTYEIFKETAANTVTVGRNGNTINFISSDIPITTQYAAVVYTWSTSANTWIAR